MSPDDDDEQRPGYEGHWEKVFDKYADQPVDSRRIQALIRADHNTQRTIADLRRQLTATQWKIHRLRNSTTSLLGPVFLVGIWAVTTGFQQAEGIWAKMAIVGAGAFGIYWLRDLSKELEDVTRD